MMKINFLKRGINYGFEGNLMAERQGFEPWVPVRVHTLSKRAP